MYVARVYCCLEDLGVSAAAANKVRYMCCVVLLIQSFCAGIDGLITTQKSFRWRHGSKGRQGSEENQKG